MTGRFTQAEGGLLVLAAVAVAGVGLVLLGRAFTFPEDEDVCRYPIGWRFDEAGRA